ncbi:MAG: AAA-like domain-containing protein [Caldilineaceae bacterium]
MRYFNTYGPVNEQEHYVVSRSTLLTELATHVMAGRYFTIYAPRQMGKTTLLQRLAATLQQQPNFLPVVLNFEAFEGWSVEDFLQYKVRFSSMAMTSAHI